LSTFVGRAVVSVVEIVVDDDEERPAENAAAPTPIARMATPRIASRARDGVDSFACFTDARA
jgi:hypothetical protein